MSTQKVAIITAATIAALIAIALIAVNLLDTYGGTPIIIKGSSEPNQNVVVSFNDPPAGTGNTLKVDGGFHTAKVTDATGRCIIYDFTSILCWANEIELTTSSNAGVNRVDVYDTTFDGIETTFDKDNFDGKPPANPKEFKSRDYRVVTGLNIVGKSLSNPTCRDKNGPTSCYEKWPDLKGLEITIDSVNPSCP